MSVNTSIVSVCGLILTGLNILDVSYASCCCAFFLVSISQASVTTAMTTSPLLTEVSSGLSSLSLVTVAPSLMGLPVTLGQSDVVLLPLLPPRCSGGVIGLATLSQQQPPPLMPLQAYANYEMGSPLVGFIFRVGSPTVLYIICLLSVLVSALFFQVPCWMPYSPMGGSTVGVYTIAIL